jgi:hypothetical protein
MSLEKNKCVLIVKYDRNTYFGSWNEELLYLGRRMFGIL